MSANLESKNGKISFVENIQNGEIAPAWHGLGTRFNSPMTIETAMRESNADFIVSKQPVIAVTPQLLEQINSEQLIDASTLRQLFVDAASCNMRTDTNQVMALTSESYGLIQNVDAFRFINNICGMDETAPVIETMGVLSNGTTFASIRMKNVYDLGGDDPVDFYLIVKNSFNNKEALMVRTSFTRVVCQNTLNAAFSNAQSKLIIRHTKNANSRLTDIEDAARTLKFYEIYKEAFVANIERQKKIKLTDKDTERIVCQTLMSADAWKAYERSGYNRNSDDLSTRTKNLIDKAMNVIATGVGQELCTEGTGLCVYNGITTLFNNHTEYKTAEKKFTSIFGGSADEKQQMAFELISQYA